MESLLRWFMPEPASTVAADVDALFLFILLISIFFFLLIVVGVAWLVVRYRRKGKPGRTSGVANNHLLEIVWTVIPSIILLVLFVWGFKVYMNITVAPRDAMEIKVTGQRWFWTFAYPEGATTNGELVIPVHKPVKLLLSSKDVIHSFFVPAFRTKQDALPNRYTVTWFEATKVGEYPFLCAEYCGTEHSNMVGVVRVLEQSDYDAWLAQQGSADDALSLEELGQKVYQKQACFTCHSLDGSPKVGPSWKGIYGKQEKLKDGSAVLVDENYIRESILNPMAKVTAGYQPVMPAYQGLIKERELDAIIAFIKNLK